jgi:hypothetical protein
MLRVNQLIGFGAGGGPQGIQFVGGATAAKVGATSGNSTIALDGGLTGGISPSVADGDFVLAVYGMASNTSRTLAITDGTTGYTLVGSQLFANSDTVDTNFRVGRKFVSGDTATTFGPTGNANDPGAMGVYVFRGVDPTTPLDVSVVTATGINSAFPNFAAITPSMKGAFIIAVAASGHIGGFDVYNTPSDLIGFQSVGGDDSIGGITIGMGHKADWVSGSFDPATWVHPDTNDISSWAAITIALRPAA